MSPTLRSLGSGRYELEERLGSGGAAQVYRARDTVLHRRVAVKVLREVTEDPAGRERFVAEARTLARLSHPGLVSVLDAGTDDDRPFLVMELVDGASLADRLGDGPVDAAAVGRQVAEALAHVHGSGIVHRDVKPANILIGADDRVRLADFGIAQLMGGAGRLTATDQTIGTAAYLSPEQARGDRVTPASDVYSLGLVLLEALTGERAYPGPPVEAALARLTRPPEVPDSLPADWGRLLRRMTAPDPSDRPSAAEVAAALPDLAAYDATTAPLFASRPEESATRVLPPSPDGSPGRRRPGLGPLLLAALLLAALLVVGAVVLDGSGGSEDPGIPPNLPSGISRHLEDLHEAVNR